VVPKSFKFSLLPTDSVILDHVVQRFQNSYHLQIKMAEKRITDKRFGVKNYIIEDLRRFQLRLKYQRKKMAFVGSVNMTVNGGAPRRVRVEAQDKRITITPSGFREGLHLPRQNIENLDERRLKLLVWDEVYIELEFDSVDDTQHFTTALGNLDLSHLGSVVRKTKLMEVLVNYVFLLL
jgi:hypothetical protein